LEAKNLVGNIDRARRGNFRISLILIIVFLGVFHIIVNKIIKIPNYGYVVVPNHGVISQGCVFEYFSQHDFVESYRILNVDANRNNSVVIKTDLQKNGTSTFFVIDVVSQRDGGNIRISFSNTSGGLDQIEKNEALSAISKMGNELSNYCR